MAINPDLARKIVDHKVYADLPQLDATFAELRRDAPFAMASVDGYDPFWVASKHADVLDIERRADEFRNGTASVILFDKATIAGNMALTGTPNTSRSMVEVDGKEHKDLRAIAFPSLTPAAIRAREGAMRGIARGFVDNMLARGPSCDFVKEVAYVYPLRVVMGALGVPSEDEPFMLRMAHAMHGATDPDVNPDGAAAAGGDPMEVTRQAFLEIADYYTAATKAFRAKPQECINSLIANARIDGEYLTEAQLLGYYIITATAGHDTTAHALGSAMWALAERPELLARLKREPEAMAGFIDESIRWATPVKHFMRGVAADTEVLGKPVKQGEWIMLAYHSANRDEEVFENPYEFNIDRPRNKHVSFGYGPHVCLGQHLARMEMRLLWEELLPRLKELSLDGTPKITESNFVCGPKRVPIRFTAG